MLYKIGTLEQFEKIKDKIPVEVRDKIQAIVTTLDREYGADRNVEDSDGGFVLFADSKESLTEVEKIIRIDKRVPELVESVGMEYLNVLFICNNEFGINLIISKDIAPKNLADEY
jgi:hypothetical protein